MTTRIVLPKKGRLKTDFAALLAPTGLAVEQQDERMDFGALTDERGRLPETEALLQRPMDAIDCVLSQTAELAVIGLDTLNEFNAAAKNRGEPEAALRIALRLPEVSACSLYIAAPKSKPLRSERDLNGLRIATSYPETLKAWLKEKGVTPGRIVEREGGVEDTIRLGMADVICDVVQSGESLKLNGLVKSFKIADSSAVVVQRADSPQSQAAKIFVSRLREIQMGETQVRRTSARDLIAAAV